MDTNGLILIFVPLSFVVGVAVCALSIRYGIRMGRTHNECPTWDNENAQVLKAAVKANSDTTASMVSLLNRTMNAAVLDNRQQINRILQEEDTDKGHPPAEKDDGLPKSTPGGLSRAYQTPQNRGNMETRGQSVI